LGVKSLIEGKNLAWNMKVTNSKTIKYALGCSGLALLYTQKIIIKGSGIEQPISQVNTQICQLLYSVFKFGNSLSS